MANVSLCIGRLFLIISDTKRFRLWRLKPVRSWTIWTHDLSVIWQPCQPLWHCPGIGSWGNCNSGIVFYKLVHRSSHFALVCNLRSLFPMPVKFALNKAYWISCQNGIVNYCWMASLSSTHALSDTLSLSFTLTRNISLLSFSHYLAVCEREREGKREMDVHRALYICWNE